MKYNKTLALIPALLLAACGGASIPIRPTGRPVSAQRPTSFCASATP